LERGREVENEKQKREVSLELVQMRVPSNCSTPSKGKTNRSQDLIDQATDNDRGKKKKRKRNDKNREKKELLLTYHLRCPL